MRTLAALASSVATFALLGVVAACAGSTDETTAAATTYQDCLRQEGIELPTARASGMSTARPSGQPTARTSGQPTARPSGQSTARPSGRPGGGGMGDQMPAGVDQEKWQAAMEKCAALRPSGGAGAGPGGGGGPGGGQGDGRQAAYTNCLAERGVTLVQGQELSTADPKTAEALKACEVLKPSVP